jgi:ribose transport system ATP-binding protein
MFRDGVRLRARNPAEALRQGIVLIPEDRKAEGLHLELPVRWNLAMATLPQRSRLGVIQMGAERAFADQKIEELKIRLGSPFQPASALSGGTQQKVVLGKFMAREPSVLLFVDPTRGIDVQTKFGVYETLRGLARSGASCVVYSSDTEELVGLCDRVAVFHDGAPVAVLEGEEITQDAVVAASFAVAKEASS